MLPKVCVCSRALGGRGGAACGKRWDLSCLRWRPSASRLQPAGTGARREPWRAAWGWHQQDVSTRLVAPSTQILLARGPAVLWACRTWHLFREGPIHQGARQRSGTSHTPPGRGQGSIDSGAARACGRDGWAPPGHRRAVFTGCQTAANPPEPSLTPATRWPSPGLSGLAVPPAALSLNLSARGSHPAAGHDRCAQSPQGHVRGDRPAAQPAPGLSHPTRSCCPLVPADPESGPSWGSRGLPGDGLLCVSPGFSSVRVHAGPGSGPTLRKRRPPSFLPTLFPSFLPPSLCPSFLQPTCLSFPHQAGPLSAYTGPCWGRDSEHDISVLAVRRVLSPVTEKRDPGRSQGPHEVLPLGAA